jgi:hypothetical protein
MSIVRLIAVAATCCALHATPAWTASKAPSSKASKTYRWVDKSGVTHYGDQIPPEYAQQAQTELNAQGVAVRETPRQLDPAEAAAAQKAAAEESRRRQHDSFLLTTYTRLSDIEQLRDERLALIDGQMELARGSITSNLSRLQGLQKRLLNFKPYSSSPTARSVPDPLAVELVQAMHEVKALQSALRSREQEKSAVRTKFDSDISRYRELTSARQPR